MDVDLPEDYIVRGLGEDSNRESYHSSAPIPVHVAAAAEEVHSSSEEVIFTNFDPSKDESGGKDVMSGQEAKSSFEDEDEEMSSTEEDKEEDLMEDANWQASARMVKSRIFVGGFF